MVGKERWIAPVIVAAVRIADRCRGKVFRLGVIKGGDEDADEIAAHIAGAAERVGSCSAA